MTRLTRHQWAMGIAEISAQRSTCLRRNVGCVLLDEDGFILATGVNGVARGVKHCNENVRPVTGNPPTEANIARAFPNACPGAQAPSGTQLDGCHAIHAEQNAMLRCGDIRRIFACYCTASPCMTCVKLLMNTNCQAIYFLDEYPHLEAMELWLSSQVGRTWRKMETTHEHR